MKSASSDMRSPKQTAMGRCMSDSVPFGVLCTARFEGEGEIDLQTYESSRAASQRSAGLKCDGEASNGASDVDFEVDRGRAKMITTDSHVFCSFLRI